MQSNTGDSSGLCIDGFTLNFIKPEHKALFAQYIKKEAAPSIYQSFAYNYAADSLRTSILWIILEDCLCIFRLHRGRLCLASAPLGMDRQSCRAVLDKCMELMEKHNKRRPEMLCSSFNISNKAELEKIGYRLRPSVMGKEYIYDCRNVLEMRGNRFEAYRRNVKSFQARYGNEIEIKSAPDREDLLKLYEQWRQEWMSRESSLALIYDLDYYKASLERACEIDQSFISVYHKGKIIGMSGIIPINEQTCMCLNRKSLIKYKGLSEFLIYKSCEYALQKGFSLMNDSWDANHEGLRRFKNKLNPIERIHLYYISCNDAFTCGS